MKKSYSLALCGLNGTVKGLFIVSFLLFSLNSFSQNQNITLAAKLSYGNTGLSNICGWKSPVDGKEYALVGAANGLSIVNVTNPASPTQITLISGPNCSWREIKTYGNYAYVTTECGTVGLQIVNLTNLPATNLQTATWTPTIGGTKVQTIHALHIDEDKGKVYLFGSNVGNKGAIIADIATNPMAPAYLGSWDNRYIHDGYVRKDTLYACHIYQGDVEVVNLANPAAGITIGDFDTPSLFSHNAWLSQDSRYCFTTDEVENSFLASYDLANLGNIRELDRIQSNPGSNSIVHNTHILQKNGVDYAVTSWYNDGFTIVDCSRPANLVQVGNYDTEPTVSGKGFNHCWGVYPFLPSGTIVASDIQNGLYVCAPTYIRASFLEGVVMNCATGNPLNGAKVQITNPPSVNTNSATDLTDALGKYGVGVATAGTYTVTISKQAYVSQTFTVAVSAGNVTTLNVNLCPQTPPFSYTGNVYDIATSAGIPGVKIHMQDNTIIVDTITDASGNFTIPGMLAGTYSIFVGKWGYVTKCFSNQNISSTSPALSVGLKQGIYDDFTFDYSWVASGACPQQWERSLPVGTIDNGNGNAVANPDKDDQTDCSDQAYITDNGGGSAANHDVDPSGYAILTSPVFNPLAYTNAMLSYSRWFYDEQLNSNPPNDTMEIYLSNGSNTVMLERLLNNVSGSTWIKKVFRISNYLAPTANMTLSMRISDANPGSLVEGGFDKFYVYDSSTVGINSISLDDTGVGVYPNPSDGRFTVHGLQFKAGASYKIEVYNVFGENIFQQNLNAALEMINLGRAASGMYFYRIVSGDTNISAGKLLIE